MAHILHLPVFPEGSPINPDAINCFIILDELPSYGLAHLILHTDDTDLAIEWTEEFLRANREIPLDEVTLTQTDETVSDKGYFTRFNFDSDTKINVSYQPRISAAQKVIVLPVFHR